MTASDTPNSMLSDLQTLATASAPGPGVTRLAYAPEDARARSWFEGKCAQIGLRFALDRHGTCYGFSAAADETPGVVLGSHLDSVIEGGRYDGTVGVVVAFEVVRRLLAERPDAPLTVLAFACEESTRFGIGTVGSRIMMGELSADDLDRMRTMDGVSFPELVERAGLDGAPSGTPPERFMGCFLEVHIDQGVDLVSRDAGIGIVDAIAGDLRTEMVWTGEAAHAGAQGRSLRRDALLAASALVVELEALWERRERVGETLAVTVGKFDVTPNSPNTVSGEVRLVVDLRSADDAVLRDAHTEVLDLAERIARRRGIGLAIHELGRLDPVQLDAGLAAVLRDSARRLGIGAVDTTSLAGHDAMVVAKYHPAALLFVRNPAGVSHAPEEGVDEQALDDVVRLLVDAVPRLAPAP